MIFATLHTGDIKIKELELIIQASNKVNYALILSTINCVQLLLSFFGNEPTRIY